MMDHRYGRRRRVALELELLHRHRSLGRFTTRDVSVDGLFLETPWLGVVPQDLVELRWEPPGHHAMTGMVIHRSADGLGIMLTDVSLAACLPASEPAPAAPAGRAPGNRGIPLHPVTAGRP